MNRDRMRWWMLLVACAVAALYAMPTVLMILSSLKPREQLVRDPYSVWPTRWAFENYVLALAEISFWRSLANSLWLCTGSVVGATISSALVAYAIARIRWRGRRVLMVTVILSMLLPWYVAMIPRFWLTRQLGLYDSFAALILPTFLGNAFFIFLLRQFYRTIPEELFEAGRLDGLSHWGLFWKICVPLSIPALTTVALFQLIDTWNDFSGPLLYLSNPAKFPLAYSLERFISGYSDQTQLLLAGAVVFTLMPVLVFLFAQRVFIQGIATTGIKG